jgi:hypothetical protein
LTEKWKRELEETVQIYDKRLGKLVSENKRLKNQLAVMIARSEIEILPIKEIKVEGDQQQADGGIIV